MLGVQTLNYSCYDDVKLIIRTVFAMLIDKAT